MQFGSLVILIPCLKYFCYCQNQDGLTRFPSICISCSFLSLLNILPAFVQAQIPYPYIHLTLLTMSHYG
jgi:hypothetical protein